MATLTLVQQAAYQRRSLGTLKGKVTAMSLAWGDLDGYFETRLEGLANEIAKLDQEMAEFISDEKTKHNLTCGCGGEMLEGSCLACGWWPGRDSPPGE